MYPAKVRCRQPWQQRFSKEFGTVIYELYVALSDNYENNKMNATNPNNQFRIIPIIYRNCNPTSFLLR